MGNVISDTVGSRESLLCSALVDQLVCKYVLIISKSCANESINYEALNALALVHIYNLHLSLSRLLRAILVEVVAYNK